MPRSKKKKTGGKRPARQPSQPRISNLSDVNVEPGVVWYDHVFEQMIPSGYWRVRDALTGDETMLVTHVHPFMERDMGLVAPAFVPPEEMKFSDRMLKNEAVDESTVLIREADGPWHDTDEFDEDDMHQLMSKLPCKVADADPLTGGEWAKMTAEERNTRFLIMDKVTVTKPLTLHCMELTNLLGQIDKRRVTDVNKLYSNGRVKYYKITYNGLSWDLIRASVADRLYKSLVVRGGGIDELKPDTANVLKVVVDQDVTPAQLIDEKLYYIVLEEKQRAITGSRKNRSGKQPTRKVMVPVNKYIKPYLFERPHVRHVVKITQELNF